MYDSGQGSDYTDPEPEYDELQQLFGENVRICRNLDELELGDLVDSEEGAKAEDDNIEQ